MASGCGCRRRSACWSWFRGRPACHRRRHDPLTGLANRAALAGHDQHNADIVGRAVLVIDLDGFKPINDRYGHHAGDAILIAVAQRLRSCLRSCDLAVRLGGDEFAVVVHDITDPYQLSKLADRIGRVIADPVPVGGTLLRVGASVGVALSRTPTDTLDILLQAADAAMYEAKRARAHSRADHDRRSETTGTVPVVERPPITVVLG